MKAEGYHTSGKGYKKAESQKSTKKEEIFRKVVLFSLLSAIPLPS